MAVAGHPLENLCWANREAIYYAKKNKPGLHTWQYQKAVYQELKSAFDSVGGAKANPAVVADALKARLIFLGTELERGAIFW